MTQATTKSFVNPASAASIPMDSPNHEENVA